MTLKPPPTPNFCVTTEIQKRILELIGSPQLAETINYFKHRALRSQQLPAHKAMIYMLARVNNPTLALEIGTFFAGTAAVIAEALWANGTGTIDTIDPRGGERAPGLIKEWEPELSRLANFTAETSMEYFLNFAKRYMRGEEIHFAFIDGNHDYEYAYFDVCSTMRFAAPHALIIMDNIGLSGVHCATENFLILNPTYQIIWYSSNHNCLAAQLCQERPLQYRKSGHYVLIAPPGYGIGRIPRAFREVGFTERHLVGIRLKFTESMCCKINYKVIMVSRPQDFHLKGAGSQPFSISGEINLCEATDETVIDVDIRLSHPVKGHNRMVEVALQVADSDGNGAIRIILSEKPQFIFTDKV